MHPRDPFGAIDELEDESRAPRLEPLSPAERRGASGSARIGDRRSRVLLLAWGAALVALVGAGVAGRLSAPSPVATPFAQAQATLPAAPASSPGAVAPPLDRVLVVTNPADLAPRATVAVPAAGSGWYDSARVPVAGVSTARATSILATVTADGLLLGQAHVSLAADGRFAGFVPITPPLAQMNAELRIIDLGPSPELLALVPIGVGTTRRLLLSGPPTVTADVSGERIVLDGIVRRDVTSVEAGVGLVGRDLSAVQATLGPPVLAATSFLGEWRPFRVELTAPVMTACQPARIRVEGFWQGRDGKAEPSSAGDVVDLAPCDGAAPQAEPSGLSAPSGTPDQPVATPRPRSAAATPPNGRATGAEPAGPYPSGPTSASTASRISPDRTKHCISV